MDVFSQIMTIFPKRNCACLEFHVITFKCNSGQHKNVAAVFARGAGSEESYFFWKLLSIHAGEEENKQGRGKYIGIPLGN